MAKLRHIAISVADLKSSADFYEKAFGMNRLRESDVAVSLSDGVIFDLSGPAHRWPGTAI